MNLTVVPIDTFQYGGVTMFSSCSVIKLVFHFLMFYMLNWGDLLDIYNKTLSFGCSLCLVSNALVQLRLMS